MCIDNEIPFGIPESWVWVRLKSVFDVRDGTHDTPKYVDKGIPLVTSKNLKFNGIDFNAAKLISDRDFSIISLRSGVSEGDVLFAMIGTIGNPVIVTSGLQKFAIKNMALFKQYKSNICNINYFYYFLLLEQTKMKNLATGGVQSFVSLDFLRKYLYPFPPIKEQERIIQKTDLLFGCLQLLKN